MKNLILTGLLTIISLAFLNQASFAQTVEERLARATVAVNKNDLEGAMPDIEEILKAQPDNATALNFRGIVYLNRKNYDQAIADCSKAIASNPQLAWAYANRAVAIERKTNPDYKSAIADFNRAIELVPNYRSAYNERGWAYMQIANWDAAESDFTQAIKYGITHNIIYLNRGLARYNSENYDQAAADYRKSLEIDPNYDFAKTKLVEVTAVQQKIAAEFHTPQLNAAVPNGSLKKPNEALNHAADFINAGNFNEAVKIFNEIIKTEPNNAVVAYLHGVMMYKLRYFEQAYNDASAAIAADKAADESLSAVLTGGSKVAEYYYLRAISVYHDPNVWDVETKRGTIKDFDKAIELNPNYADAYRERGAVKNFYYNLTYYTPELTPGGIAGLDLNTAVQLNPNDGEAYFINGLTWVSLHNAPVGAKEVVDNLTKAINLGIIRSEGFEQRGYANFQLNNRAQAIADYQKAVELDPNNATAKENLNRLNSNQKKVELQFRYTDLPVYRWTAQMRELLKKYNETVGIGNSWSHVALEASQYEICQALVGRWTAAQFSKNYLKQLSLQAHREIEKKTFLELSNETFEQEKKAFEEVKAKRCAY